VLKASRRLKAWLRSAAGPLPGRLEVGPWLVLLTQDLALQDAAQWSPGNLVVRLITLHPAGSTRNYRGTASR
jgi:hypothetical protein